MSYMPMNPVLARRTARILCSALPAPLPSVPMSYTRSSLCTQPQGRSGGSGGTAAPTSAASVGCTHAEAPWVPGNSGRGRAATASCRVLLSLLHIVVASESMTRVSDRRSHSSGWRVEGVLCHLPWSLGCKVNLTWINIKILWNAKRDSWHTDALCV